MRFKKEDTRLLVESWRNIVKGNISESMDESMEKELEYYKNLVSEINSNCSINMDPEEGHEYVELGSDSISIKIQDSAKDLLDQEKLISLEEKINKIANAHFSLHGRVIPSSELVDMICSEIFNSRKRQNYIDVPLADVERFCGSVEECREEVEGEYRSGSPGVLQVMGQTVRIFGDDIVSAEDHWERSKGFTVGDSFAGTSSFYRR